MGMGTVWRYAEGMGGRFELSATVAIQQLGLLRSNEVAEARSTCSTDLFGNG